LASGVGIGGGGGGGEEEGAGSLNYADGGVLDLSATFSFSRLSNSDALSFRIEKNC
jgi:hypothetical protein